MMAGMEMDCNFPLKKSPKRHDHGFSTFEKIIQFLSIDVLGAFNLNSRTFFTQKRETFLDVAL